MVFDIESADLDAKEGLTEYRRKLTKKCKRKASDDGSWTSGDVSC